MAPATTMSSSSKTVPRFPSTLTQESLLPCPPLGRKSSPLTKHILFYVHEWLLKPLSKWYTRLRGIPPEPYIHFLPFGFVLKSSHRVREQEGLAMNLARAMGVPAPRFISFGEPLAGCPPMSGTVPSLLMTQIPGTMLSEVADDEVDFEAVRHDLLQILASMRRFTSPYGGALCGVDGGPIHGHFIPLSPLAPCTDEAAFHDAIRGCPKPFDVTQDCIDSAERFFELPRHPIVFTHGDLLRHNIMLGDDGRVSGIIDWEAAAWLPEYWEISVTTLFPGYPWGQLMDKTLASGVYATVSVFDLPSSHPLFSSASLDFPSPYVYLRTL